MIVSTSVSLKIIAETKENAAAEVEFKLGNFLYSLLPTSLSASFQVKCTFIFFCDIEGTIYF